MFHEKLLGDFHSNDLLLMYRLYPYFIVAAFFKKEGTDEILFQTKQKTLCVRDLKG